jgi:Right handed beta helix region
MKRLENPNWAKKNKRMKWIWIFAVSLFGLALVGVSSVFVLKKYDVFDLSFFDSPRKATNGVFLVHNESELQKAINAAKPGETIMLAAGSTFKASVKLPNKKGNEFITIRTSAKDSELPAENVRLDPKKYGSKLAKIVGSVKSEPVIYAENGAHHYRFIGIEFGPTPEGVGNIIKIGTTEETSIEQLPHHLEFDRVFIHGDKEFGQRRGIAANGKNIVIKNSYFSDIMRKGEESQAIAAWATDGPIEITNNYLEAAAENILFGGADSTLKLITSDCIIRDNWLNKPIEWRGSGWDVKNFFEIKNGRRMKISHNLMTNNWVMAQAGTAILFNTRADTGSSTTIEDIEFTNNIIRGTSSGISIYGPEGSGGKRLAIRNNIFDDINTKKWEGDGFFIKSTSWEDLKIENNTIIQDGNIASAYDKPINRFVFRNNIIFNNEYGFKGDGFAPGKSSLEKFFPNSVVTNNIIIGGESSNYGSSNFYPKSLNEVGFVNLNGKDFRLRTDSQFFKKGSDGKPIGANLDPTTVGGTKF